MSEKVKRYVYPAVFTYEDGQEIAVSFPDLDVATSGENDHDALMSARELLGCVMFGLEEDGEPIPKPSPLNAVYAQPNERVVLVDADMPLARMAQNNKVVNQTALSKEMLVKFFGENGGISRLQEEILIEGRNASLSECIPENEIDW